MSLLSKQVIQTLNNYGFIVEYNKHKNDYLVFAKIIYNNMTIHLRQVGIQLPVDPQSLEDFADKYLVNGVKILMLSNKFPWFRHALITGMRIYIKPCDYEQQFRTSSTGCGGVGGGQGTGHAPPRPPRGADTVPDVWSSLRCFSGRCWG